MNSSHLLLSLFACFLYAGTTFGDVVKYEMCHDEINSCSIQEVRITPCDEPNKSKPCRIKKGKSYSMEVDFTPEFSADTLTATAYWKNSLRDLPFAGMDTNACNYMTCPMKENVKTTYNFNLDISKKLPSSSYNIKWKFQHEDKVCCAYLKIALIK